MTDYDELPQDTQSAIYVHTLSGAVHELRMHPGSWRRLPAPTDAPGQFPMRRKPIFSVAGQWAVGGQGYLECADETYMTGRTWHLTSTIVRITDEAPPGISE